jgi:hypothetical protein
VNDLKFAFRQPLKNGYRRVSSRRPGMGRTWRPSPVVNAVPLAAAAAGFGRLSRPGRQPDAARRRISGAAAAAQFVDWHAS